MRGQHPLWEEVECSLARWHGEVEGDLRPGGEFRLYLEADDIDSTGRIDAVEMINFGPCNHLEYYRYLNGGYRLPLVGGTDKMSSAVAVCTPPGYGGSGRLRGVSCG